MSSGETDLVNWFRSGLIIGTIRAGKPGTVSIVFGNSTLSPWRRPTQSKETLARMLDAPISLGKDWRLLAKLLNVPCYTASQLSCQQPWP